MYLLTHLGLGDQLICYGLVKELSQMFKEIKLFTKEVNMPTVLDLYEGTNVYPILVKDELEAYEIMKSNPYDSMIIGYGKENESEFGWSFYKDAGLPYHLRYKYKLDIKTKEKKDVLVLDTDNFSIPIEGKRLNGKKSLFDYKEDLENAKEIHLIESSWKLFIELLNLDADMHYYYFKDKSWRVVPSKLNYTIHE